MQDTLDVPKNAPDWLFYRLTDTRDVQWLMGRGQR